MSKITDSARMEECTFMLPEICSYDPKQTVYCHGPHPDRGTGYKHHPAAERWGAYGCTPCHQVMDNRAHAIWQVRNFWRFWFDAIRETQRRLIRKGILK